MRSIHDGGYQFADVVQSDVVIESRLQFLAELQDGLRGSGLLKTDLLSGDLLVVVDAVVLV